jgi:uncharacterized protein (TIGR02594 family)
MMSALPKAYEWLLQIKPLPRMVQEALKLHGTAETMGAKDNPVIVAWAKEIGPAAERHYYADEVPWCGLFAAVIAKRAGKALPMDPLWALNWKNFGIETQQPALGDVLTFQREGGGHVGLYVGEDKDCYHVLGGNQSDQVCFTRIIKGRLKGARRPYYQNQPKTVKPYILAATGGISSNEG